MIKRSIIKFILILKLFLIMNRRELLKWSTPVIVAVSLPAHAQTSMIPFEEEEIVEETPVEEVITEESEEETPVEEFVFPDDCKAPFVEPQPGFGVKGQCKSGGLKATELNDRAFAASQRLRNLTEEDACKAVRNYNFCEFTLDENLACNELERSIERSGGIMANILDCD